MKCAIVGLLGAAIAVGAVQLLADSGIRGRDGTIEVKRMVAAQAAAEYGVRQGSFDGVFDAESIRLETADLLDSEAFELVRASLPIDHAHPYLVLVGPSDTLRLGGFEEVQLTRAMEVLGIRAGDEESAIKAATSLVILADANGAERLLIGFDSVAAAPILQEWNKRKPATWPPDQVVQRPDGYTSVRLTVMSQRSRSYDQAWQPTTYQFEFSADGELLGWARMSGEAFPS